MRATSLGRGLEMRFVVLAFSLILLLFVVFLPFWGGYYTHLGILAAIGVILALGTNISIGYCGVPNFGLTAFCIIGGFSSVLLQTRLGMHFFLALIVALFLCGLLAKFISIPFLRLRTHFFFLATGAVAMVISAASDVFPTFTGGEAGLQVPALFLFGYRMGPVFYYLFAVSLAMICYLCCRLVVRSRLGYAMKAVRQNEVVATSLGVQADKYRSFAFVFSCVLAGLGGVLYTQYISWVAWSQYPITLNITYLMMIVIGGMGSNLGSVIGGALVALLPEALAGFQQWSLVFYGAVVLIVLRFLPHGVAGYLKGIRTVRALVGTDS